MFEKIDLLNKVIFKNMEQLRDLSEGVYADWKPFTPIMGEVRGFKTEIGVYAPDGKKYLFSRGERLIHEHVSDGRKRTTFIITQDGAKIPFDVWKEDQIPQ